MPHTCDPLLSVVRVEVSESACLRAVHDRSSQAQDHDLPGCLQYRERLQPPAEFLQDGLAQPKAQPSPHQGGTFHPLKLVTHDSEPSEPCTSSPPAMSRKIPPKRDPQEAVNINQSLFVLRRVIAALSRRDGGHEEDVQPSQRYVSFEV